MKKEISNDEFEQEGIFLVDAMVKSQVDLPTDVVVNVKRGEQTYVFEVKVPKTELGKVIGKDGKTASAMRRLLHGFACKCRKRAVLEIIE